MSREQQIELDSYGTITNHGIHDATIVEIRSVSEGKTSAISIRCKMETGGFFTLNFLGTIFYEINFYGPQNVILEISVITKQDATNFLNEIKNADAYIPFKFSDLSQSILHGNLTFVEISPSVGAQIKIICEKVELVE